LTGFSETGLYLHSGRKSRPRNTRVPLNTCSIAPNQPHRQHNATPPIPTGAALRRHVGLSNHPGSRATESRDLRGQYRPRGIISREHVFDAQRGQRDVLGRSERREHAEERQFAVGSCVTGGQERSLRCSPRPVNGLFAKPGLQERLIRIHTWLQGGTRGRFMAKVRQKRRPDLGEILRALSNRRSSPAGHAVSAASPGSRDRG